MTFTLLNNGATWFEGCKLNIYVPTDITLRLYTNNRTPVVTDTAANYTECALAGYAAVDLLPANWSEVTAGGVCTASYPAVTFTFNAYAGGTTIYGAYLTDGAGTVLAAGLLDVAFAVPPAGGSLTLTVSDTQKQC